MSIEVVLAIVIGFIILAVLGAGSAASQAEARRQAEEAAIMAAMIQAAMTQREQDTGGGSGCLGTIVAVILAALLGFILLAIASH